MAFRIPADTGFPSAVPLVMGIVNVTPDSFSDGGRFLSPSAAVSHAIGMIDEGADIIDVGPESTRPDSEYVGADEQINRAIPVIESIREHDGEVAVSIDTRLAPVARAAIEAGANIVNDVSALRDDPEMAGVIADAGATAVLMHMKGTPMDMQKHGGPQYDDVVNEVSSFLIERRKFAIAAGVDPSKIVLDPGIGFGKRVEHNLLILKHLDRFVSLGSPVLIGASRKSFIGKVLDVESPRKRDAGSLACAVLATLAGAAVLRVHDVRATVEAIRVCQAVALM